MHCECPWTPHLPLYVCTCIYNVIYGYFLAISLLKYFNNYMGSCISCMLPFRVDLKEDQCTLLGCLLRICRISSY